MLLQHYVLILKNLKLLNMVHDVICMPKFWDEYSLVHVGIDLKCD